MDMETTASFDAIIEHNASQTAKVLDALSQMTDWMNTVQESIDNINMQLKLINPSATEQDTDSEPCITKAELTKSIEELQHKFTEKYCNDVQQREFY